MRADYIAAGACVATANAYASSRLMLSAAGMADRVTKAACTDVEAAFRARDRVAHGRATAVAGSLFQMAPHSAGTTRADEDVVPTNAEMLAGFRKLATALAACGCDLILLEMMDHPQRMPLAIKAALETDLPVWLGMSARLADDEQLLSHTETETIPFSNIWALMPDAGVDVAGMMHTSVTAIHAETANFEVRASKVSDPSPGDQLTIAQGEPARRDPDRLVWSLDVRKA